MKNKIEKIVLWRDEPLIRAMMEHLESLLPLAQRLGAIYHEMPFAEPEVTFFDLFANTESKANEYLRKQAAAISAPAGLAIDQNRYAQLFRLPQLDAFNEAKQAFIRADGDRTVSYFRMKGQGVVIDPVAFEKFSKVHTIQVEEESKELYRLWTNMIAGIVEFNAFIKKDFTFMAGLSCPKLPVFLKENRDGSLGPNPQMFRTVAKQLQKHTS